MKKSDLFASLLMLCSIAAIPYVHAKIQSSQAQSSQPSDYSSQQTISDYCEGTIPEEQKDAGARAYSQSQDISLDEDGSLLMHELSHNQEQKLPKKNIKK